MTTILFATVIFFASMTLFLFYNRFNQKKNMIKSLTANQIATKNQLERNEAILKSTLSPITNPEVIKQIEDTINKERECYQKITTLLIDYPNAAIEMTPFLVNSAITEYMSCIQKVISHFQQLILTVNSQVNSNVR